MQSTTFRGSPVVTAPGKLFLIGEYAVLEGGVAVVAAVDRRARGQYLPDLPPASPVVDHAVRRAAQELGDLGSALPAGSVLVDTTAFRDGDRKLGFGSSAAAAVASVGAVFEYAGLSVAKNVELVREVADEAHRLAQGGAGSGADVAAAAHGGIIRFQRPRNGRAKVDALTLPPELHIVVFWSGTPASTPELIAGARRVEEQNPALYRWIIDELQGASGRFADAIAGGSVPAAIEAAAAFLDPLDELGAAAGTSIVTAPFQAAAKLARELHGAAKPSGAGGGDVGVAFLPDFDAARAFQQRCPSGISVLDVRVDGEGVARRLPSASRPDW